ncbi:hypothetical protein BVRB_020810, partial [Beta vulgaris subsp. vulgaris]
QGSRADGMGIGEGSNRRGVRYGGTQIGGTGVMPGLVVGGGVGQQSTGGNDGYTECGGRARQIRNGTGLSTGLEERGDGMTGDVGGDGGLAGRGLQGEDDLGDNRR